MSELLPFSAGIDIVGPLPADPWIIPTFSGGARRRPGEGDAARAWLAFIRVVGRRASASTGMEPV